MLGAWYNPASWFSDPGGKACIDQANSSKKVAELDALIMNLAANWKPTGYYYLADVEKIVQMLDDEAREAGPVLSKAPLSTADAESAKRRAFNAVLDNLAVGKRYLSDVAKARDEGKKVLNSPRFRVFVIQSFRGLSDLYVTAAVLYCRQSDIERVLGAAWDGLYAISSAIVSTVNAVFDTAKDVANATGDLVKLLMDIIKGLKYVAAAGAIGGAGYLTYRGVSRYVSARQSQKEQPKLSGARITAGSSRRARRRR